MAENTNIEWCHHTFNPWIGCTRLSPACEHCYAEVYAKRTGQSHLWTGERRRTSASNWRLPLKWDQAAAASGIPQRVFCASLADVFDNQVPVEWRHDLWKLIAGTRDLDWMLLTKRPQNIAKMLPVMDSSQPGYRPWNERWPWRNVWLGTTVEDRERLRNIAHLRAVPAAIRFLSIEPLLEDLGEIDLRGIDLVIVGGESGPGARQMHPAWARSIRDQCDAAGVAFLFKQWGEWIETRPEPGGDLGGDMRAGRVEIVKRHGEPDGHFRKGDVLMRRVGKKAAGRLLDGVEHNGMPTRPVPSPPEQRSLVA